MTKLCRHSRRRHHRSARQIKAPRTGERAVSHSRRIGTGWAIRISG
jgi:IS5 family transposase